MIINGGPGVPNSADLSPRETSSINRAPGGHNGLDVGITPRIWDSLVFRLTIEIFFLVLILEIINYPLKLTPTIYISTDIGAVRGAFAMSATVGSLFAGFLLTIESGLFRHVHGELDTRRPVLFLDWTLMLASHLLFIILALISFYFTVKTTELSTVNEETMVNLATILHVMIWAIGLLSAFIVVKAFSALVERFQVSRHGVGNRKRVSDSVLILMLGVVTIAPMIVLGLGYF